MNAALSELIDKFSKTLRPDQLRDLTIKLDAPQEKLLRKIWCNRLDHRLRTTKHFEPLLGYCVCESCEKLPRTFSERRSPMTTSIRPLHDRILVKRLDAESKTPGGLFIPDAAKEKPVEGLVVAVGDGTRNKEGDRIPLDVKAGDRVLFSRYSGAEVKVALGDGEHLILREDDVLAVLS